MAAICLQFRFLSWPVVNITCQRPCVKLCLVILLMSCPAQLCLVYVHICSSVNQIIIIMMSICCSETAARPVSDTSTTARSVNWQHWWHCCCWWWWWWAGWERDRQVFVLIFNVYVSIVLTLIILHFSAHATAKHYASFLRRFALFGGHRLKVSGGMQNGLNSLILVESKRY